MPDNRVVPAAATEPEALAAGLLDRAAEVIEERGWCRGSFETRGHVCALGALNVAAWGDPNCGGDGSLPSMWEAYAIAEQELCDVVGGAADTWNDAQHSKKLVIAKLREAAGSLRG